MQSRGAGDGPAGSRALAQYRWRASHYDAELAAFSLLRRDAVAQLRLRPGDSVIDVGCGTGLSFDDLEQGVGPAGRITGVEPSPDMLALARQRVARHGWRNVALAPGFAARARLRGKADAALFMFTHDVMQDAASLDHVLAHLRPDARVVAAGLRWAPPWSWPVNGFVLLAALYSVSSLQGLGHPWQQLQARLAAIEVQPALCGSMYIASGTVA
jgi:demethylmenaquinone methyltransferase/2-methoxy-6-polyprenyl-1,4-benzoquinol methylase